MGEFSIAGEYLAEQDFSHWAQGRVRDAVGPPAGMRLPYKGIAPSSGDRGHSHCSERSHN